MAEDPSSPSPTTPAAPSAPPSDSNIQSSNMTCKGVQRNLPFSPSNAAENRNPNINQGSCKRKINSFSKSGSADQSDVSPKVAVQACADLNLISPPRKHVCGLARCASKNPHSAAPATVIPMQSLVSKRSDLRTQEVAPKTCKCSIKRGNSAPDDQTASMITCNCICSHDSLLRRWSSDDKDWNSLAGAVPSPFSLPAKTCGREGFNASQSSQGDAFTQVSTTGAHSLSASEIEGHGNSTYMPLKSWGCLNDSPNLHARHGSVHSQNNHCSESGHYHCSGINNALEERRSNPMSGLEGENPITEDQEGVAVSPSPEKTGNWRLKAVLEAFGNLSPTREGRVKTLVRAFESLLSVKDKGDQQAGGKPRSYPLQFSYLTSNGKEITNEKENEDGEGTVDEGDGTDQPWERQDAEYSHDQQQGKETEGGGGDVKDDVVDETPEVCREESKGPLKAMPVGEGQDGLSDQTCYYLPARRTSMHEQASHIEVLKKEKDKQERRQTYEHQHVKMPQEKLPSSHKPCTKFQPYSLQRFSMDGHSSTAAARKKVCNKSGKPSLGSNCGIPSSRPPLAQKPQMQPAPEKPQVSKPQPFKLLTQERGTMKEQEFFARLRKLIEEEEKLRVPLAQGLPWTTDEPEILLKPPVKENTIPLDIHLNSDLRAMERAEFDRFIAEKLLHIEERRMEEERVRQITEEEDIRRMRQEMVPKAQLMPYFDRPFRPRRSSKRPTIPKEPQFQLNSKQSKRQKCVSSSFC
ncbi:hypothetical protein L7F22_046871 [Adiantum nelumboides]|nr:hypothetical protein [Adiantum nelumboides]